MPPFPSPFSYTYETMQLWAKSTKKTKLFNATVTDQSIQDGITYSRGLKSS